MWRENKIWHHYLNDIIATDSHSADFLAAYLQQSKITKSYIGAIEVLDLQKYKVITQPAKVRLTLRERLHIPFVFVAVRN